MCLHFNFIIAALVEWNSKIDLNRPVLIVGQADSTDYVILLISRITNNANIDTDYDFPIEPQDVPLMNLTQNSYIRTHKQSIVHAGELTKEICSNALPGICSNFWQ